MEDETLLYELLALYFSDEATPSEKEKVERWREELPEHEVLFHTLREQWEEVKIDTSSYVIPDRSAVWGKIQQKIHTSVLQVPLYTRALLVRVSGIAAAIALVVGFSLAFFIPKPANEMAQSVLENVILAPSGQKSQLVLPDGTKVWLNSGSKLTYNSCYALSERIVELEGEAYFDVKQNQQFPFTVKAGVVDVKVHGTAFNVNAYADENTISVALVRGKVSLVSSASQELLTYLTPNQAATVSKSSGKYQVISCDAQAEACWHLNLLKFEGASTEEVWKKLGRWYGVKVSLLNVNPQNTYWFTLKMESLIELLEMINRLTPIEYKLNGEEVIIKYK